MGLTDRFGLSLSTVSAEAVASYVAGVDLLLSANVGAEVELERAVAADPGFALAHIARARMLQLRARMPEAKVAVMRARALCEDVTPRERQHIDTIARAVDGAAVEALTMVRAHASEYPRDALPLSLALGVFGLLGFSGHRDHHQAQPPLPSAPAWRRSAAATTRKRHVCWKRPSTICHGSAGATRSARSSRIR